MDDETLALVSQLGFPLTANALRERQAQRRGSSATKRGDPMASYVCDLCGWQSEDPAAVKDHMRAAHGVAIENAAIVGSLEQDDGLLILRDQDGATALDMGAWLGAQLAKIPRGPAPADLDTLTLTTAHAASSYGRPVLVIEGEAYGPADMTPAGVTGAELVNAWAARFCGDPEIVRLGSLAPSDAELIARVIKRLQARG